MIYTTLTILGHAEYSECTYRDRRFIEDNCPGFNSETDKLVRCQLGLKHSTIPKDVIVPEVLLRNKHENSFITLTVRVLSALVMNGCHLAPYCPVTLRCRLLNTLDDHV